VAAAPFNSVRGFGYKISTDELADAQHAALGAAS